MLGRMHLRACTVARAISMALVCLLVASRGDAAGGAASIMQFSPHGTVKRVRQVVARFSEPMVPLGDPRGAPAPFDIGCPERGSSRWLDSRTWAYDFDRDLPAGIRCTFRVRADLKSLAGAGIAAGEYSFDTGGPAIVESRPWQDSTAIDEQQAFVLVLDAEAEEKSILDHAGFAVRGLPERVGATILSGSDRDVLIKRFARMIAKRPVVILAARQRFPNGANVSLVWGAGIASRSGIATEQDQVLKFRVRSAFEARFECQRESPRAGCIPLTPMRLAFSAPIKSELARGVVLIGPDGARIAPKLRDQPQVQTLTFDGPFTESARYRIELPSEVVDIDGRPLANASRFPLTVATDEFPPLAKFSARFGIIEAADPVLPVTVRNLEAEIAGAKLDVGTAPTGSALHDLLTRIQASVWRVPAPDAATILPWLRRVAVAKRSESVFGAARDAGARNFAMPKPNGAKAFEVMGIALRRPGLYIVELKSAKLGTTLLQSRRTMYVPTAALVTNLAVHFKRGYANSLIWVTELENAQPVAGADVAIADCEGTELWRGRTDARGIATVTRIDKFDSLPHCGPRAAQDNQYDYFTSQTEALRELQSGLIVTARKGGDFSFVHSSWQFGIEPWRFELPTEYQPTQLDAHTVFDRPLFRAGETVHMKHFIRARTTDGFGFVAPADLPDTLTMTHVGGEEHYDFDLDWNAGGTAVTVWQIPKEAKLGQYAVAMVRRKHVSPTPTPEPGEWVPPPRELPTGDFRVEEFRVPLMRAAIRMSAAPQVAVSSLDLDLSAEYLSGGAAKFLPITLRSQILPNTFVNFPGFEQFTFSNGVVKEGVRNFESWYEGEEGFEKPQGVHQRKDLTLDAAGGVRTSITDIPRQPTPVEVRAELEYRDPNGESQTVSNSITIFPARRLVGVAVDGWTSARKAAHIRAAVVDDSGEPVANAPVRIVLFRRTRYSYRTRLVGGFYAYQVTEDTRKVGELCSGRTDAHGLFACDAHPSVTGEMIAEATVSDDAGNSNSANAEFFIPGEGRYVFESRDEDRMDVVPERPQYEPGDTARLQVRMPFAEATALVSVEREGILAASVIHLSGKDPVVTLPVRNYAPNVFVSVLALRGRIGSIQPAAMVDLGRPAFKLGIAELRVGWREHRLAVTVTPEHEVYRVREKARVRISVRTPDSKAPPAGSNVLIAAVDEGLLELRPNESWRLLDAMMGRRPYQVETATASMQVVGKRHFGLKALPPGGGGGRAITRELFDTLLLWRASVALDAHGEATVEIPLNDSLTSFRIVAVVSAGAGQFGTGAAVIRSTQDLQLLSGVSPIIRTGDSFGAEFTVRNASERALDVTVGGHVEGIGGSQAAQTLKLAPSEGRSITWNITVPDGVNQLTYHVDAVAAEGPQDHLKISERVLPAVPVRVTQATLLRLDTPIVQPVARPQSALAGAGGIAVTLSPSLAAGLDGVRDWMRVYPYVCLEQRVSRAVALNDAALWAAVIADLPAYMDSDGLLKYFPAMRHGSDVLTAYVVSIAREAELAIPAAAEAQMTHGLRAFVEGRIVRYESIPVPDLPLRKLAAIAALARANNADPALLGSITIEPDLWPDSAVIDWWSILLRMPSAPERERRLADAEQVIRARLVASGTALHLGTEPRDRMWWLMVEPESNMLGLAATLLDFNLWRDDLPKLMRGALDMRVRGAWPTTVANAWGTVAVSKFVSQFEKTTVSGTTGASLTGVVRKLDWSAKPGGGILEVGWPPASADLRIAQSGTGNPWVEIRTRAAIPLGAPIANGYRITKTFTPVDGSHQGGWRRGDLVRVHLKVETETDMTWVVVNDPIPAGASHLGGGLARDSELATAEEKQSGENYFWPAFIERPFDAYRAYYEYVPKGTFETEYTIRLNQAGKFAMPPTRIDALYEPDVYGELPNAPVEVAP